jgi:hypothetical protein
MCQSHLWAIVDSVPEGGVLVEWGSGYSTKFWLDNASLSELWTIENDVGWEDIVRRACADDPRLTIAAYRTRNKIEVNESVEGLAEYATAKDVPVDRADVIFIDGFARSACMATAALRAKKGAKLFLHDTDSKLYKWAIDHMESHQNWREFGRYYPLPEDRFTMEMIGWQRIA